ncbi:tetracycline resistance MFS efflux pump [soil metagenome]
MADSKDPKRKTSSADGLSIDGIPEPTPGTAPARRDAKMLLKSPLFAIFLIVAVDVLGFTMILPLLPFYAQRYGASPFLVGVLATTFAVCQLVSGPFLGRLSDKYGRKPVLMLSQFGTFVGFIMLGLANSLPIIFLSRIIDGATAGNLTIAQAAIADVTPPEGRARAFGVIGIAFGLGFLIGPAISAALAPFGVHYPAYCAAMLSGISIFATWRLLPKSQHQVDSTENSKSSKRLMTYLRKPDMRWLLIEFLIFGFIFAGFTSGFALFAERRFTWNGHPFGASEVSLLFTYSGFLGLIFQGFILGRLVKKFGESKLVWAGFASMAISYFLLASAESIAMLVVASTIGSFGTGVIRPALTALVSRTAGPREQGAALGATQSLGSLGQIFAPLISGGIINASAVHPLALAAWGWWLSALAILGLVVRHFTGTVRRQAS